MLNIFEMNCSTGFLTEVKKKSKMKKEMKKENEEKMPFSIISEFHLIASGGGRGVLSVICNLFCSKENNLNVLLQD